MSTCPTQIPKPRKIRWVAQPTNIVHEWASVPAFSEMHMTRLPKMHWLKDPLLTQYLPWIFTEFQNLVQVIWVSKHQYDRPNEASRNSFRETSVKWVTHHPTWRMLLFKRPYNAYFLFYCQLISIKKELFKTKHVQRVKNRQPALQNETEGGPKPPLYYSLLFLSFRHQRTVYFKELLVTVSIKSV
jgi:hypothetical protein